MRALILSGLLLFVTLAGCADSQPAAVDDETFADFEDTEVSSGKGLIRGVVVDPSITPIEGVTIRIGSLDKETTSNEAGAFQFADLDPGAYFLDVEKLGFADVQTSAEVVADVASPPVIRILMEPNPSELPRIQPVSLTGHLTCGVAVAATSIGCTIYGPVADQIGDQSIFRQFYGNQPDWLQGELIWESTQTLSGAFIWEITPRTNNHIGYRETAPSPALAYLNTTVIQENAAELPDGLDWRFFAGPHELCPATGDPNTFGCGVTIEQDAEIIIHEFYNMVPDEGWRYTSDGEHAIPT